MSKPTTDHLGNVFPRIKDMCEFWKISYSVYHKRINEGMSQKDALETKIQKNNICNIQNNKNTTTFDHCGNKFTSLTTMCNYWNKTSITYNSRINKGWTQENALTIPTKNKNKQTQDHTGTSFESIDKMIKHWNVSKSAFYCRIASGLSLEEALTKQEINTTCKDHTGKEFESLTKMLKYWCISMSIYQKQTHKNIPLKDILEGTYCIKPCRDHIGNEFKTKKDMLKYWGVSSTTYKRQIDKNISLKDILEQTYTKKYIIQDYKNRIFSSKQHMASFYNLKMHTFHLDEMCNGDIMRKGFPSGFQLNEITKIVKHLDFPYTLVKQHNHEMIYNFEQILQDYHNNNFIPIVSKENQNGSLIIKDCIDFPYYNVEYNGQPAIWSYWKIIGVNECAA